MNAPRTVTVHTRDHGPVTIPEPAWCLGDHAPQDGGHRADIAHDGEETAAMFHGRTLLGARLTAYPFSDLGADPLPLASVELDEFVRLTPEELDGLAAVLVAHATRLRHLARTLAVLRAGGEVRR
ncbi:hypothetical protein GCM10023347_33740 [Streptomyces chumphonensis]|uniref:Uncharacterized protein n=1 Tax=Streptomyces chumphonensis TaxID=1214925 RepID=A0A927F071_9ACTN|nr:hypothetical protein [Streptomyces chumphonensis]MBD3931956.1 hypothetical protein [Streptomyces chumphonensis]